MVKNAVLMSVEWEADVQKVDGYYHNPIRGYSPKITSFQNKNQKIK